MKLTPEHYCALRDAIDMYAKTYPGSITACADLYRNAGHSPMRFRWDVLTAAGVRLGSRTAPGTVNVYDYANDDHVDTALRKIFRESGVLWAAHH